MNTYDYINRVVITLPVSVYEGTWKTLFPLIAMHHLDGCCVCVGFFFEITALPNMHIIRSLARKVTNELVTR